MHKLSNNGKIISNCLILLDKVNAFSLVELATRFNDFSFQDINQKVVDEFKATGLLNTDYLFSDFLNQKGFDNLINVVQKNITNENNSRYASFFYSVYVACSHKRYVNSLDVYDFTNLAFAGMDLSKKDFFEIVEDFGYSVLSNIDYFRESF